MITGVFKIAMHKRAVVLYCYTSHAAHVYKYFNNGGKRGNRGKFIIFLGWYAVVSMFSREIKELSQISQFQK